jgi:hypothetical protein
VLALWSNPGKRHCLRSDPLSRGRLVEERRTEAAKLDRPSRLVERSCPACSGTGKAPVKQTTRPGVRVYPPPCKECGGKGRVAFSDCAAHQYSIPEEIKSKLLARDNVELQMTELLITGLHHDLNKKRSFVYFGWKNDPDKRLGLDVPFQCSL